MARHALPALVLALAACAAHADDLGTLFYTPAQRAQLDRLRRGEAPESAPIAAPDGAHAVTGYVQRSDGRGVVWIDGRPLEVRNPADRRVFDPSEVSAYSRSADEVKIQRER